MTTYTIKTTEKEANDIARGGKTFIFRNSEMGYRVGDSVLFRVIKNSKPKMHDIEKHTYVIAYLTDNAPIESGFVALGLRRVK